MLAMVGRSAILAGYDPVPSDSHCFTSQFEGALQSMRRRQHLAHILLTRRLLLYVSTGSMKRPLRSRDLCNKLSLSASSRHFLNSAARPPSQLPTPPDSPLPPCSPTPPSNTLLIAARNFSLFSSSFVIVCCCAALAISVSVVPRSAAFCGVRFHDRAYFPIQAARSILSAASAPSAGLPPILEAEAARANRLPGLPASLVELILLLFSASLLIIVKQLVLIR